LDVVDQAGSVSPRRGRRGVSGRAERFSAGAGASWFSSAWASRR
jgi:hypothetical protein